MVCGCEEISMTALADNLPFNDRIRIRRAVLTWEQHGVLRTVKRLRQTVISVNPSWVAATELIALCRGLIRHINPEFYARVERAKAHDRSQRLDDPNAEPLRARRNASFPIRRTTTSIRRTTQKIRRT
jgi:hypothetical protein